MPIAVHIINLIQVTAGKLIMRYRQKNIVNIGVTGTPGHLNFLSTSGIVFLKTITPTDTAKKADRVPILHNSISIESGKNPPKIAVAAPVVTVQRAGVL